ncbi:MAG: endolytic transglycosylase MltG [Pseudomonadota bacterium]
MLIRAAVLLLLCFLVASMLVAREALRQWETPLVVPAHGYTFTVAGGDSLRSVVDGLHAEGVLLYPDVVALHGRLSGADQQIHQGEYRLGEFATPAMLLNLLRSGQVVQYRVTLPEGITLRRAIEILQSQEGLAVELDGEEDPRIRALVHPDTYTEGWFFPDSYQYTRGDTDWDVLQRAHTIMRDTLEREWETRAEGLPYETPYDALIMASIVERETGQPSERAEISGVFARRLHKGMRLQTDPTVIYGLGDEYDGNLRRSHLRDDGNPYNTYRHTGLPPSPIALPGGAALHAALHPADGTALFFVARGDGGHVFSDTLAEHERAVRKYQLQRRKDYRSSPQP